jgi:hypothetical protein
MPNARPLIVTADPHLLEDLVDLIARAGLVAEVMREPGQNPALWAAAPIVLTGSDALSTVLLNPDTRRPGLILAVERVDGLTWQVASAAGVEHVALLPDGGDWLVERVGLAMRAHLERAAEQILGRLGHDPEAGAA